MRTKSVPITAKMLPSVTAADKKNVRELIDEISYRKDDSTRTTETTKKNGKSERTNYRVMINTNDNSKIQKNTQHARAGRRRTTTATRHGRRKTVVSAARRGSATLTG